MVYILYGKATMHVSAFPSFSEDNTKLVLEGEGQSGKIRFGGSQCLVAFLLYASDMIWAKTDAKILRCVI